MSTPAPITPPVYIVGFYDVEGFGPDSVEVRCSGDGPADYAALNTGIRAKHPGKKTARTGSQIESRDPNEDPGYIDLGSGQTLRQLFDPTDTGQEPRTSLRIGRVFFGGSPCNVVLTFNRAGGRIGVVLLPRVAGSTAINFQTAIQPQLLVEDLPRIINEVLGSDARALDLNTRKPAPVAEAAAAPEEVKPKPTGKPFPPKSGKAVNK